jgi:hypothetical protein
MRMISILFPIEYDYIKAYLSPEMLPVEYVPV